MGTMLEKREQRNFQGVDIKKMHAKSMEFWRNQLFNIIPLTEYAYRGEHFTPRLGLQRKIFVSMAGNGNNVLIDLTFSAEITETGAVAGAIGAVLLFPVAAAVGAVSYFEYENDANNLMRAFWEYMTLVADSPDKNIVAPVLPTPEQQVAMTENRQQMEQSQSALYCSQCGAKLDRESKFCKYCGSKV
jgi:hypothetical protein